MTRLNANACTTTRGQTSKRLMMHSLSEVEAERRVDDREGSQRAYLTLRIQILTLSGARFFRYRKDRGNGFQPPFDSSENWYVEYSICTYAPVKFLKEKFLVFKVDLFQA